MYCPNCDMEFVDGVTICTDCGRALVEKEEWLAQKKTQDELEDQKSNDKKQKQIREVKEALDSMTEEEYEAMRERQEALKEMMKEPSVYVNRKDKAADNRSSAIALSIVGVFLAVAAVLMWTGVLFDPGVIINIAVTLFAALCIGGAIISFSKAKKYSSQIDEEEDMGNMIIDAFLESNTAEEIDSHIANKELLKEEELVLERMKYIQDKLSCEYNIPDQSYNAMIAEEIFEKLFEQ